VLHADLDGDSLTDTAVVAHGRLHVETRAGVVSTRVPPGARLDGAMRIRGLRGMLLLVRVGSRQAVNDAVYRVTPAGVARVHLHGGPTDELVRMGGNGAFADFDCGRQSLTVEQIDARPNGSAWDETVLTYALGVRGLVLKSVRRITVTATAASTRRCALIGS
jgi:hypothetical protein